MREGKQAFALTDTNAVWHMRCRMAFYIYKTIKLIILKRNRDKIEIKMLHFPVSMGRNGINFQITV